MPSTRYGFSAHTQRDWDVIEWLDSFHDPRERTLAIKAAIREYMRGEQIAEGQFPDIGIVEDLQKQVSEMYRVIVEMKNELSSKEFISQPQRQQVQTSRNKNAPVDNSDPAIQEATNNLLNLFGD